MRAREAGGCLSLLPLPLHPPPQDGVTTGPLLTPPPCMQTRSKSFANLRGTLKAKVGAGRCLGCNSCDTTTLGTGDNRRRWRGAFPAYPTPHVRTQRARADYAIQCLKVGWKSCAPQAKFFQFSLRWAEYLTQDDGGGEHGRLPKPVSPTTTFKKLGFCRIPKTSIFD